MINNSVRKFKYTQHERDDKTIFFGCEFSPHSILTKVEDIKSVAIVELQVMMYVFFNSSIQLYRKIANLLLVLTFVYLPSGL